MSKTLKMFICIVVVATLLISFSSSKTYAIGDLFKAGANFLKEGNSISSTINTTELKSTSDYIYNALLAIGVMVAIIVAMVLGIQFMAASADEKAKVKEAFLPFIVGCIVVFGSFVIWKLLVNIGNNAENAISILNPNIINIIKLG